MEKPQGKRESRKYAELFVNAVREDHCPALLFSQIQRQLEHIFLYREREKTEKKEKIPPDPSLGKFKSRFIEHVLFLADTMKYVGS